MTYPDGIATAVVTFGPYYLPDGVTPAEGLVGYVGFDRRITSIPDGDVILPGQRRIVTDEDGRVSIELPYCDQDGITPTGFPYHVKWRSKSPGLVNRSFWLRTADGAEVDYDLMGPPTPSTTINAPIGVGPPGDQGEPGPAGPPGPATPLPATDAEREAYVPARLADAALEASLGGQTRVLVDGVYVPTLDIDSDPIGVADAATPDTIVRRTNIGGLTATYLAVTREAINAWEAPTKGYVDGIGTNLSTPDTVVRRSPVDGADPGGWADFSILGLAAQPSAAHHATRRDYVDGRIDAKQITDWNTALVSGIYYSTNGGVNTPEVDKLYLGQVEGIGGPGTDLLWITQTVHEFNADGSSDTKTWRRSSGDIGGGVRAWGAWYRLRISEAEQNATLGTPDIIGDSIVRRDSGGTASLNALNIAGQSQPQHATRKDYVDARTTIPSVRIAQTTGGQEMGNEFWGSAILNTVLNNDDATLYNTAFGYNTQDGIHQTRLITVSEGGLYMAEWSITYMFGGPGQRTAGLSVNDIVVRDSGGIAGNGEWLFAGHSAPVRLAAGDVVGLLTWVEVGSGGAPAVVQGGAEGFQTGITLARLGD